MSIPIVRIIQLCEQSARYMDQVPTGAACVDISHGDAIRKLIKRYNELEAKLAANKSLFTECFKRFIDYMEDSEEIPPHDFGVFMGKLKDEIL